MTLDDTCQSASGVQVGAVDSALDNVEEASASAIKTGKLLLASEECNIKDEFDYNGVNICNASFAQTQYAPLVASMQLSALIHAFEIDTDNNANFIIDKTGSGVTLSATGSLGPNGFTWTSGNGMTMPVTYDPTTFSIEMVLSVDAIDNQREIPNGYVALVHFLGLTNEGNNDKGWYFFDGLLEFFNLGRGVTAISPNQVVHIVLTRSSAGLLTGYLNGVAEEVDDDQDGFAVSTGTLYFFVDDEVVSEETAGGTLKRLRIYNRDLTADEVLARYNCAVDQGLLS